MSPAAETLWRWIETELMGDENRTKWSNTLAYDTTIDEPDINEMVTEKFGAYKRWIRFENKANQFKMQALPMQNKHDREKHAYQNYHGHENMVNIVAWPDPKGANVFNLHINVRRAKYAKQAAKKQANAEAAASGGWQTV